MTHYILGLLTADGSTRKYCTISGENTYSCDLEMAEEQIVLGIAKFLNKTVFYRERVINDKLRKFWKVSFYTDDIEMIKYGKYLVKGRPNIYELYKSFSKTERADFVRGLFDGDGSICQRKNGTSCIGFSINSACNGIREIIEDFCAENDLSLSKYYDKRGNGSWYYSINSKNDKIKFANIIYESDGICLQRKKETFIKIFGGEKRMETTGFYL